MCHNFKMNATTMRRQLCGATRDLLSAIFNKRRTLNLIIPMMLHYTHVSAVERFYVCCVNERYLQYISASPISICIIHLCELQMCNGITLNHKALFELLYFIFHSLLYPTQKKETLVVLSYAKHYRRKSLK